ncbi:MAG: S-methyl-5'-thioadenosine phosphorylase [Neomegalonema sp.]|nr:S-methyl-5'-thioadenosine phosphorylase [Neomegalonema sp.]
MGETVIGVIGGSGLYEIAGLEDQAWQEIDTPWGKPSDAILTGRIGETRLAFLPRHGRGHRIPPHEINYRANIDALKRLGVTDLISFSACGSFREEMAPGDFVIADQFIDRTIMRKKSFFGTGCVAHVSIAEPTCARLRAVVAELAEASGVRVHRQGTYLTMEGPQFSTLAESRLYRENWGCDIIGMTNMPEAKLAREAELCYATVAMVTDYDSWHHEHGEVDVPSILKVMAANSAHAKAMVAALPSALAAKERPVCPQGCDHALEFAIITAPEARDPAVLAQLDAIAGRVL